MDTEKLLELEHKIEQGKSLSDEGPYYHHTWWEAYKGASKGELGGVVLGAALGIAIGSIAAVGAALFDIVAVSAPAIILTATAGGMIYGLHKFANVGAVAGAVSSTAHQGEARMRAYEEGKFAEIKQEISEIKAMVKGEAPPPRDDDQKKLMADLDEYRTTHYAKLEAPTKNKFVFWKIASMGLVVGMAAGAVLAAASPYLVSAGLLGHTVGIGGAMATLGALGASLGINRDIFRQVFDKTDLWFKGIFNSKQHDLVEAKQEAAGVAIQQENGKDGKKKVATLAATYEGYMDYPASTTHYRDKLDSQKLLSSFDHTRATPQ